MGRQDVRAYTGCPDCSKCTTSHAGLGLRNAGRGTAAVATAGISEAAMLFTANCRACGHKLSLHKREGAQNAAGRAMSAIFNPPPSVDGRPFPPSFYEGREVAATPSAAQQAAPVVPDGPEAGWYSDPDGTPNLRWWNGREWTDHRK